ncbi:MAG: hypothetical protein HYZ63_03550 [Candidatus Andersenbacteria bacterium]|nr:hypothetical protein [Candidatus Andersenbacteria bacterium]
MKIGLKLKSITYSGKSIGRNIRLEIEALGKSLQIKRNIERGSSVKVDEVIAVSETHQLPFASSVKVKIVEEDLLFDDMSEITIPIQISDVKSVPKTFEQTVSVTERKRVFWKSKAVFTIVIEAYAIENEPEKKIKKYQLYLSEDYNQYDSIIEEVVNYWNNEFSKDTNPPPEILDPNLVKAIAYQETRIGNDKNGKINIMQVGNTGDPSLKTLRGELLEYWIHKGEKKLLKYNARIESPKDSIYWGVRWLYHKAQGIRGDKQRYWRSWKEAVHKYGPGKPEYVDSVWRIYTEGTKKEKNKNIKLWAIIPFLVLTLPTTFGYDKTEYIKEATLQTYHNSERPADGVKVQLSDDDPNLFFAIIEREKDWWENLYVGRVKQRNIEWLEVKNPPTEQSILSARFIKLKGMPYPILEVYGKTHNGNGKIYVYRINEQNLSLILSEVAVDSYNENVWRPEGYPQYGYNACGQVYQDGKLTSDYKDFNGDGMPDLLLSGTSEIICESIKQYDPFESIELKVDKIPVRTIHSL